MKKIFTILFSLITIVAVYAQTIYSENMGTVSANTAITAHTGWQNGTPIVYTGSASVRNTTVSSGYTGASGAANIFFPAAGGNTFIISGLNTSGYQASNIQLSFGLLTASAGAITVEYSDNNGAWQGLTIPANTGTGWTLKSGILGLPASNNLALRFTGLALTGGSRIDDVIIKNVSASCTLVPGTPETACDAVTSALDTYTITIPYTNGATGTFTVTSTSGTVGGDNPTNVAAGNIVVTGTVEGTNNTITINGGAGCSFTVNVTAPTCKPINTLPLTDTFSYTDGTPLTSSQTWNTANSGDDILVSGGAITFSGAGAEAYTLFTDTKSGTLSATFNFSATDISNLGDGATTYFAALTDANGPNGATSARVWIKKVGTQYQFGLSPDTSAASVVWSPNLYDQGTSQVLTISYDFAANKTYLLENQSTPATPSVTVTPTAPITSIGGFIIRQDSNTLTPTIVMDNLNINTNALVLGVSDINTSKVNFVKNTLVDNNVEFAAKANIQIVNANGQVVKTASVNENTSLDVASLAKGVYIITGEVNGKKAAQKIIKK